MGLVANKGKTYLSTSKNMLRIGLNIMANYYTFEVLNEFVYFASAVTSKRKR